MKKTIFFVILFAALFAISSFLIKNKILNKKINKITETTNLSVTVPDSTPRSTTIVTGLDTPWSIVFLPDKSFLIAERKGTIKKGHNQIAKFNYVEELGEGGLLGMAIHPDFQNNHYIYFYYTYKGDSNENLNRVVRMIYKDNKFSDEKILLDKVPAAPNHNGGRLKFGPDKMLYITTGDAQNPSRAQEKNSLSGKILRISDDGKTPSDNPFNSLVYSYGHRNPQGLAWDENGQLYATEHGRSGILSGFDEFNKIIPGKNYGWPDIQGDEKRDGMETPLINSGPSTTWAPAGLAFYKGAFYFGGLKGEALYRVTFNNGVPELKEFFKNEFGRIRDVVLGPDSMLYISTSNLDGRGTPKEGDDKIIRINPEKL